MKALLLIFFTPLHVLCQHYVVVPTMNNPEQKAKAISKRFYQLSRPDKGSDYTEYLFSWHTHPQNDSVAISVDTSMFVPKGNISASNITAFISEVYGSLSQSEINALTAYINSNTMLKISVLLLASRVRLWTKTDMEARGWFNY